MCKMVIKRKQTIHPRPGVDTTGITLVSEAGKSIRLLFSLSRVHYGDVQQRQSKSK